MAGKRGNESAGRDAMYARDETGLSKAGKKLMLHLAGDTNETPS